MVLEHPLHVRAERGGGRRIDATGQLGEFLCLLDQIRADPLIRALKRHLSHHHDRGRNGRWAHRWAPVLGQRNVPVPGEPMMSPR